MYKTKSIFLKKKPHLTNVMKNNCLHKIRVVEMIR